MTDQPQEPTLLPYRDRLKAFLADFPIKDGWKRISEPVDPALLIPALGKDYKAYLDKCYGAGVKPMKLIAYRATLKGENGEVYCNAHKISLVEDWTSVQSCETGAMARLLAHCGYPAQESEESDNLGPIAAAVADKPQLPAQAPATAPTQSTATVAAVTEASPQSAPPPPAASAADDAFDVPPQAAAPQQLPQSVTPKSAASGVPQTMLSQIKNLCTAKKLPYEEPTSLDQARIKLRELLQAR